MGNENSQPNLSNKANDNGESESLRDYDKFTNQMYEEFFINHHKLYNISNTNDISLLNPKRIVFISIRDLYASWKRCPSISLYNAIIVMPLKKQWIISPDECQNPYSELLQDNSFLTLLRWKDRQKLAVFLLDREEFEDEHRNHHYDISQADLNAEEKTQNVHKYDIDVTQYLSISPVWRRLSLILSNLHDPMSRDGSGKYNPLMFSKEYWRCNSSLYCPMNSNKKIIDQIFLELYTVTMRFKAIELILTENNKTLNVITVCTADKVIKKDDTSRSAQDDLDDSILDATWWIADDYHEDEDDGEAILQFEEYLNHTFNDHEPDNPIDDNNDNLATDTASTPNI